MAATAADTVTTSTDSTPLVENKRVNYELGMILGVDEFQQEQEHFEWHHHLHNELLHGYGTVCGLKAGFDKDKNEIIVTKGYAVSPEGRLIWQDQDICANLPNWINGHRDELADQGDGPYLIYLTLCYAEEKTDKLPVAGQACATLEDDLKPSRILETYRAEMTTKPPVQIREDTFRAFGELLRRVEVAAVMSPPAEDDSEFLLDQVRALPSVTSPGDDSPLLLDEATVCDTMQQVLTVWATEVCPKLRAEDEDDCVLLACIEFNLIAGLLDVDSVVVTDCDRPILVPERLLQELFCLNTGITDHGRLEGLLDDDHPHYLLADGSRPLENDWDVGDQRISNLAPAEDPSDAVRFDQLITKHADLDDLEADDHLQYLRTDGSRQLSDNWDVGNKQIKNLAPATDPGDAVRFDQLITKHADLDDLEADDHLQYLRTDGSRQLSDNWDVGNKQIRNVADGTAAGHVVTFEQAVKNGDSAGGDLDGKYPKPQVIALQKRPVLDKDPARDEVLTWVVPPGAEDEKGHWEPRPAPSGGIVSGDYVIAPDGYYEIVGAGIFAADGAVHASHPHTYNGLIAERLGQGHYRLTFTGLNVDNFTYIVKGTIYDPNLPAYIKEPFNPDSLSATSATFQVVKVSSDGIEVMISQPYLPFWLFLELRDGASQPQKDNQNIIWLAAVDLPFMVEISAYPRLRVNINTAGIEELMTLPNIADELAKRIIKYREEFGAFTSIFELTKVSGISERMVREMAPLITV